MTAPAPLAAAIEEARSHLDHIKDCDGGPCCINGYERAMSSLLLALDADDRLAKAEAALRHCASAAGNCHPADGCRSVLAIHRDYFAEKGDDRG